MSTADCSPGNGSTPGGTPNLRVIEGDGFVVLGLEGEFDVHSAPQILDCAAQIDSHHVIIDLSEATFIDSAVIETLLRVHKQATDQGRTCVLQLGTAAIVERVLEITGVNRHIPRAYDHAEAVDMIRQREGAREAPSEPS